MSELLNPPRGMRDFYPAEMAVRNAIFDAWRAAAARHGFEPYDACVVESLDLLKRKAGEEITNQIYAFTDKSGRELALRPEMTPTLARMIGARHGALTFPLKWCAIAQCFRYERMTRGRKREHYQWNLDVVGETSELAEVEILATARDALDRLGIDRARYRIRYSSRQLLAELLLRAAVPADKHATVFLALDKMGKVPEAEILAILEQGGLGGKEREHVHSMRSIHSLDGAASLLGESTPGLESLRRFESLAAAYGLQDVLTFDISVIRGLAYYTGIVFEAFDTGGELRAIFGGGRYANLLTDIAGLPMPAVGLGFGDVVVAEMLDDTWKQRTLGRRPGVSLGYMTPAEQPAALRAAALLRGRGIDVDLALQPQKPKAFFARASRSSLLEALYIGPDESVTGRLRIKNLETGLERSEQLPPAAG